MENKKADRFLKITVYYFKVIGFEFDDKHRWMKFLLATGLTNMALTILGQIVYLSPPDDEFNDNSTHITYINYYTMTCGKIIALLYNQKAIRESINEFRQIYPSIRLEKAYNLKTYLNKYLKIETILLVFFQSIVLFHCLLPLTISLVQLVRFGSFINRVPLMMWYPFDLYKQNWVFYGLVYMMQVMSMVESAIIILGLDLCLFSSLIQLCMHFDIISKNILQIEPDESYEAERRLKEQIAYHQRVLTLAEKINNIFTPSVLFSLLSSSFILCFVGYQLLGDISLVVIAKLIFLLAYELKQVVITCFLGDRLIEISVKVSDSIYEHNWYNGTPKYKRLVLIMLMRSQKRTALNIAGVSDVSLQTLRQVLSISYQIFTVLKSR